ncbi:hypothetical protein A8V23_00605 [Yersinia pestis]|uniref:Uncharacterized protein n=3 Tax=Yersinia pestis TaxID=632 RepID=Q8CLJ7_YERPE|nr:hypothetical [Yersinia pestis KIM10+]ABP41023.1 conserved hypothetical protein [Yersinia pestis Pestoides F]ADV99772.1 hypothetical protein YPC_3279 [Yersinia pestis biovar Medievalis str. Harbin 35]AEL73253.1 hypothetical protein A1122_13120 [Yersinia pestis A1122]ANW14581.1 hypothetical protein BAY22_11650 [Yersinia pestis]EDR33046.1 conserved hypothetical protein [Yersinia pestis biovar Orientalis str. IP275]EDR44874.1 conserved hypothetical protein [Yersinia pestis biovar Antiqua str. 
MRQNAKQTRELIIVHLRNLLHIRVVFIGNLFVNEPEFNSLLFYTLNCFIN